MAIAEEKKSRAGPKPEPELPESFLEVGGDHLSTAGGGEGRTKGFVSYDYHRR